MQRTSHHPSFIAIVIFLQVSVVAPDFKQNLTSTVVFLQSSEQRTTNSYAILNNTMPKSLDEFTLCYRIKIFFYRPEVTVFSFIDKYSKIRTDHNRRGMQIFLSRQKLRVITNIITPLLFWSSFCFGFSSKTTSFDIVYNGKKWKPELDHSEENESSLEMEEDHKYTLTQTTSFKSREKELMAKGGTVVLGQDQDVSLGGFDAFQSFCGQITGVQLWSRMLTIDEMIDVTSCKSTLRGGDVINWDTAVWTYGEDYTITEDYKVSRSCRVEPVPYFLLEERLQFSDSAKFCQALGGDIVLPADQREQDRVYELAQKEGAECLKTGSALIWIGITDNERENVWTHHSNKSKVIRYQNWSDGQPNGGTAQNCAVMKAKSFNGTWSDTSCSKSFKQCVMCKLDIPVFIRFRGICDAILYDDRYIMKKKKNNQPYFRGYYRSHIFYNGTNWRLENIMKPDMFALMEESGAFSVPIGRHKWRFSHGFCGHNALAEHSLTLTQCAKNKEFTCNDGTCIPVREVCDRREQCPDKSDEMECSTVHPPPGYKPTLPPPNPNPNEPLNVYLNLTLSSFTKIDAVNEAMEVELVVRMIWKDQRLMFKHLRKDRQLNIILPSEAKSIWVPVVDFMPTKNNMHTLVDEDCKITIKRLGQPDPDDIEESREARVYKGKENFIRISRKYIINFICKFNFFNYPFNADYCQMRFIVNKNTNTYVRLKLFGPGIRYEGPTQLVEYEIGKMSMQRFHPEEPYSAISATIQLKHMFATQVVAIFVPITLLNLIGFATFFYKWFDFQNRIMVTLTSLLVMTTLFAQVSDTLPKTSYIKMMDIWFVFSLVFSFVIIGIHTMIESAHFYNSPHEKSPDFGQPPRHIGSMGTSRRSLKVFPMSMDQKKRAMPLSEVLDDDPHKLAKTINKWGFILSSVAYVTFLVVFWGITYKENKKQSTWNVPEMGNGTYSYPDE